jgi:predicted DNA-binding transcriptional regulator AlpA
MHGNKMSDHSYSVDEFCQAERISRVLFYKLLKEGRGPRVMKLGARTTISPSSRAEWHARMEAESATHDAAA